MDCRHPLLDIAQSYLREFVAPQAAQIDSDPAALQTALKGLGERSLLALRVPQSGGAAEVSEETFRTFQEIVTRYSGALAFLQTQHQSAGGFLAKSENEALKQEYLPHLATGKRLVGVGFSQLRRQGEPALVAQPVAAGFLLNGYVPWITGFGCFQEFIAGATLPDGGAVFGVVPFVETYQAAGGKIIFSEPMELAAMASTNTVTAQLTQWFLPKERVVFIKPAGWIHENDRKNVLQHSFFALGCARAGLDIVEEVAKTKQLPFINTTFDALDRELLNCRAGILEAYRQPDADRLKLRAWAIELACRCATAAVTVSSGAANYKHHAAQRVYREALVFTVAGQTTAVMEATLSRLIR
ncbi:acyl-CoA dehydrogenase family protein [Microcoleus sp. FACHB-68]|uniref:acyl-CoA dehydrogenase family protein n=1 Tax=Microcoleus sp. FACHB-68 TaxID=2692826 RepID=UPI001686C98F|nr:acyl-CoA dehydrogenase family protein [Microcoleus sp. FACHB-68]MBD1940272.1 acyl-CoA/acyl-ACP dehydrogenase [Microcoleus sp. FACHB-68]